MAASRAARPGDAGRPGPPRALAWGAVAAVFTLMTLGNVVSATGSGLACPDWPLCHGRLIPPLAPDVLIEYGHRLAAVAASVLLLAVIAWSLGRGGVPGTRGLALALLALLAAQVALGGITVLLGLPHLVSTAHLVNALLIFAGLLALCRATQAPAAGGVPVDARTRRLCAAGTVALLAQLALGGYVRHAGAGLACPDFPLCSGALLPDRWLALVHWTHRWLGVILLGLFVHLARAARRTPVAPPARLALGLALAQVTLGILTVWLQLHPAVRATHAAVGYALWGALAWTALGAGVWRPAVGSGAAGGAMGEAARVS